MKAKLTGPVQCLKCKWEGQPKDLIETNNFEVVMCPNCKHTLIDFSNGNFIMDGIKADKVDIS